MDLKISKKIEIEKRSKVGGAYLNPKNILAGIRASVKNSDESNFNSAWNYFILFLLFVGIFAILIKDLVNLQVTQGVEMLSKSENNKVKITKVAPLRGVILDRNGVILAKNDPSMNVYILVENYLDSDGYIKADELEKTVNSLSEIIGENWKKKKTDGVTEYSSIMEKILSVHKESPYFREILIATDIDNDTAIKIKANLAEMKGVYIDDGNKRQYPEDNFVSQMLGYTGEVTAEILEKRDYVSMTDVVGLTGLEREYDKKLFGEHGETAWEVNAVGKTVSTEPYILKEPVAGSNLYLTLDINVQKKLYSLIEEGVSKYKAVGGAAVLEDVTNGELLSLVSFPTYDNNLFVNGISQTNYNALLNDSRNPLMNRAIAAQMPPGSTFKVLVAAAALDAKAVNKNTIYVSRSGYTFSSGAPFQEYHNNSYGPLNMVNAISVSSNIYFCELIRNWDMNALVPYLEKFGIGRYTGIDIPGEAAGRLPSPANKIALANTTSPWLEPVWYPEGDSCNSVIGQGITLVTPLQMANWTAAIANGGTLHTPHLAKYFENEEKKQEAVEFSNLEENIVSTEALDIVKDGMFNAVNGPRATIGGVRGLSVKVVAKTGTAEFGKLNKDGIYEHTHAWVTTFFPYENPKYALTIFLEDGGQSYNATALAREMIIWMSENGLI
ncbi:MAG: penicillin-binding protein 2 [Candidatus Dojkabacteria bacterium]|jgi:penicillin-binding protein 2